MHAVTGSSKLGTSCNTKRGRTSRSITLHEYTDVLSDTLLRGGQEIFKKHKVTSCILQQDNDGAHKVAQQTISSWNMQASTVISLIQRWPQKSPDRSPIENMMGLV
jgi:D-serine deaminase-like pyridoxal phosphate-dependent protein